MYGQVMGVLPKTLFAGAEDICDNDLQKIKVNNFSDNIETVLGEFAWDGQAAATIGLTLSADNKRIESGLFITRGALSDKRIKMPACSLWEDADPKVVLTINLTRAEVFKFTEGGLYSQYADQGAVNHYLHSVEEGKAPQPIMEQEKEEWQIGNFCLRQICNVSKSSTAKHGITISYVVMIYPTTKDGLLQGSELASSPSWPGLKLCSGEMQLLPRPTAAWRCPVLPLLRTSSSEERTVPSGTALRHAIGAIMGKSGGPDIVKDAASLLTKWDHLAAHPEEFREKAATMAWPEQASPEPETGKKKFKCIHKKHHTVHQRHH